MIAFLIIFCVLWLFLPVHFWSVEHLRIQKKYGARKGNWITKTLGMISGWGFFACLFFLWIWPQPRYFFPLSENFTLLVPLLDLSISTIHLIISLPIIALGAYLGIAGVKGTTLKVSESHKTDKIVTSGVYSRIRHPQYLGAVLSHLGISVLLSAFYSTIITPLVLLYNVLVAWKEEKELKKEFPEEYNNYAREVPKFFPKLRIRTKNS
ncbi:MAG: DUF1295 domain-containing protein [Candidatus Lokiarchaeota archaeon]|nr:DUF1295 domain-containing protein [Candidatus Lokiarchaeota archaeon]